MEAFDSVLNGGDNSDLSYIVPRNEFERAIDDITVCLAIFRQSKIY